ncbi:hypothetical protein CXG81DRAFT_17860 [Caulochytrium protostelioides]|uniref:Extracellular membrane protein CFEM domain-containing protein n=1 Tax=Caulochytrium protostelioides TaxID=1555241 RepID=A0A4V1IV17_9FUNG|nr:hypothetical protein CXG81DRAFT_17860 [Caulochytrium protostelioides]|eukprot:RKP02499.1 hypothetical protein CXG81DRAFT_17860 [Caulochytrium protostelioides]
MRWAQALLGAVVLTLATPLAAAGDVSDARTAEAAKVGAATPASATATAAAAAADASAAADAAAAPAPAPSTPSVAGREDQSVKPDPTSIFEFTNGTTTLDAVCGAVNTTLTACSLFVSCQALPEMPTDGSCTDMALARQLCAADRDLVETVPNHHCAAVNLTCQADPSIPGCAVRWPLPPTVESQAHLIASCKTNKLDACRQCGISPRSGWINETQLLVGCDIFSVYSAVCKESDGLSECNALVNTCHASAHLGAMDDLCSGVKSAIGSTIIKTTTSDGPSQIMAPTGYRIGALLVVLAALPSLLQSLF